MVVLVAVLWLLLEEQNTASAAGGMFQGDPYAPLDDGDDGDATDLLNDGLGGFAADTGGNN